MRCSLSVGCKRTPILLVCLVMMLGACLAPQAVPTQISTSVYTEPLPTQYPTLEAGLAAAEISTLFEPGVDCYAPCFWGLVPGQTTLSEAQAALSHFGFSLEVAPFDGRDVGVIRYDSDRFSMQAVLSFVEGVLVNVRLGLSPKIEIGSSEPDSFAYSIDSLINRYGSPSNVDFFVGRGDSPFYGITLYFAPQEMIVDYASRDLESQDGSTYICPLRNSFSLISVWLGEKIDESPLPGIPLEAATSLSMKEFSKLMTGDPHDACLVLRDEMFP